MSNNIETCEISLINILPNEIIRLILEKTNFTKNIPLVCKSFNNNYNQVITNFLSLPIKIVKQKIRNNDYDWELIVPLIFKMNQAWRKIKLLRFIKKNMKYSLSKKFPYKSFDDIIEENAIFYYVNNKKYMFYKLLNIITPNKDYFFNCKITSQNIVSHLLDLTCNYNFNYNFDREKEYIHYQEHDIRELVSEYIIKYFTKNLRYYDIDEIIYDIIKKMEFEYDLTYRDDEDLKYLYPN
jgi:hypothetical protein